MNFQESLTYINKKYRKDLYSYVSGLFREEPVPSHDHNHHMRVWNYALSICAELDKAGKEIKQEDLEALIFACFFHDTGLTVTKDQEHGKAGKEICLKYLKENKIDPVKKEELLEAIEMHDDKNYSSVTALAEHAKLNILTVLNLADDLDAFGNIGIYRYAEIYLLRGIPMEDLGLKIIANLSGRFNNFMFHCRAFPPLIKEHSIRYSITEKFFRQYNLQIRKIEEGEQDQNHGPVGIIKHIFRQVMMGTPDINEIADNVLSSEQDPFIIDFFLKLKEENEI